MKLTFIRHASLIPPYNNYELLDYDLLAGLSRREISPWIDRIANIEKAQVIREQIDPSDKMILSSEAIRTQESAELIFWENTPYIVKKELNEIPFDLTKLCTPEEFRQTWMKSVRKAFFESFVGGTSLESLENIHQRILDLEEFLISQKKENSIIITHGWLMRFLYAHFVLQRDIYEISVEEYLWYPVFGHLDYFEVTLQDTSS